MWQSSKPTSAGRYPQTARAHAYIAGAEGEGAAEARHRARTPDILKEFGDLRYRPHLGGRTEATTRPHPQA
jgi:hypothetical protein